jgi:hypothetical protein
MGIGKHPCGTAEPRLGSCAPLETTHRRDAEDTEKDGDAHALEEADVPESAA